MVDVAVVVTTLSRQVKATAGAPKASSQMPEALATATASFGRLSSFRGAKDLVFRCLQTDQFCLFRILLKEKLLAAMPFSPSSDARSP